MTKSNKKTFVQIIKEYREKRGISQMELCKHVDTYQEGLSRIETGKQNIDIMMALRVMRHLNIPKEELDNLG